VSALEGTNRDDQGTWPARIYLVRHGRTELNAAGAFRGHLDVALDAMGRKEASRLGRLLGQRLPRRVVTSPLRRAVETGDAIARQAGVGTHVDLRLVDRDYGEWAGTPVIEVINRFGSVDAAPGVEPAADVQARALAAMLDIARGSVLGATVAVSHDAINRTVLAALDPALGLPDEIPQDTGCFNTIVCDMSADGPVRWRVLNVNELPDDVELEQPRATQPEGTS